MTDEQIRKLFHDLKNDFASTLSLLNLHKLYKDSISTEEVLSRLMERQLVISTAYEQLYIDDNYPNINLSAYTELLMSKETGIRENTCSGLNVIRNIEKIWMPLKKAIPLNQILIELLSNSCLHAFRSDRQIKEIVFSISRPAEGKLKLEYQDNGCGLPEDFEPGNRGTLGMQFITMLSKQLGGTYEFTLKRPGGGMGFRLEIGIQDS